MEARQSHLFTVRIWAEEEGGSGSFWRGQVEHVLSGERQYFRDWDTLVEFLQLLARKDEFPNHATTAGEAGSRKTGD